MAIGERGSSCGARPASTQSLSSGRQLAFGLVNAASDPGDIDDFASRGRQGGLPDEGGAAHPGCLGSRGELVGLGTAEASRDHDRERLGSSGLDGLPPAILIASVRPVLRGPLGIGKRFVMLGHLFSHAVIGRSTRRAGS